MHAQRQIVESEELDNAEFVIQELGEKVDALNWYSRLGPCCCRF